MKRRIFYSFHYEPDSWRAGMVRNIGVIEGNRPATDNDWEVVKQGGDQAIKKWINNQMHGRSCAIVLVGTNTARRKWINHEIVKAWDDGLGVVGICIYGLADKDGRTSGMGRNPFGYIDYGNRGKKLSSIVKCYAPAGRNSRERYDWIAKHLSNAVEEAIKIRNQR